MRAQTTSELEVLYEDRHILAVNKPAGLLTAKGHGDVLETLYDMVAGYVRRQTEAGKKGYFAPIHFLDRPVSGVIIYAKSSKAAARLNAAMQAHKINKTYWAVVHGEASVSMQTVIDYLRKDTRKNLTTIAKSENEPDAKYCELSYKSLEFDAGAKLSLVEVRPKTGRSHQIRVQLAGQGLPIFADRKYGATSHFSEEQRIALHARRLELIHPVAKKPLVIEAPVPQHWKVFQYETLS